MMEFKEPKMILYKNHKIRILKYYERIYNNPNRNNHNELLCSIMGYNEKNEYVRLDLMKNEFKILD